MSVLDHLAWKDDAACRGLDPDLFYPEKGANVARAKAVCAGCTVTAECLAYGLSNYEQHGVWGGFSVRELRGIRSGRLEVRAS